MTEHEHQNALAPTLRGTRSGSSPRVEPARLGIGLGAAVGVDTDATLAGDAELRAVLLDSVNASADERAQLER